MLTEVINGKRVTLSPEKEAEVRQSWKDEETKKKAVNVDVPALTTETFAEMFLRYEDDPLMTIPLYKEILATSKAIEAGFSIGSSPSKIIGIMEELRLPPAMAAERDALVKQYKTLVGI